MKAKCIKVQLRYAEMALQALRKAGLYLKGAKPKQSGSHILIPVREYPTENLLGEIQWEACEDFFEETMLGKTYRDLLRGIIPDEIIASLPRSYVIIGDIAVLQLPESAFSYADKIAEAVMKISKNVRAVYSAGHVETDYRVRRLTHLGGERRTHTIHREYGINIYVDIGKAYFNPSLSNEHWEIAQLTKEGETVLDLFTGVGPFALHIAVSKYAKVFAVDINPEAIKCLIKSIELNRKYIKGEIIAVNSDAYDFLSIVKDRAFDRVIMNLPHKAKEFLPLVEPKVRSGGVIHLYLAHRDENQALKEVGKFISRGKVTKYRKVLEYAPYKYIFRVDISL